MIKGQKPFLDYKINPDTCLNFGSDLFTVQGKHGRKYTCDAADAEDRGACGVRCVVCAEV